MTEIRLRQGANLEGLIKTLATEENEPNNVFNRSLGLHPLHFLTNYLDWADRAAGQLGNHLVPAQVAAAVYTRHFWALRQMTGGEPNIIGQVANELKARGDAYKPLRLEAAALASRWTVDGVFVVLDTNALVHTKELFDDIRWPAALGITSSVHIVVPMAVVDELDRLKRATKAIRSQARQTIKRLEALVTRPDQRAVLRPDDDAERVTTVEVLVDPLTHVRLADADSEIVDRTHYLTELVRTPRSDGDVRLVTWDGGMRFRALGAGLTVAALAAEYEDVGPT